MKVAVLISSAGEWAAVKDSFLQSEYIPQQKAAGAIAANWESASLAWIAQKNKARLADLEIRQ